MKHRCRNCHFLAREDVRQNGFRSTHSWTKEEREKGRIIIPEELASAPKCRQGIWDTGIDPNLNSKLEEIIDKNRKEDCFFIEHSEGMSFDGATELHRIKYENRQLKRSYRYTLYGLIIAGIGLLTGAFFQAATFFFR